MQLVEDCPNSDGKIVFTGHRGCGKSTLLAEFGRNIEDKYFVVFFSIAETIEMSDVNHINILFSIAVNLMLEAEARQVDIPKSTKDVLDKWFAKRIKTEETSIQSETNMDLIKYRTSPLLRIPSPLTERGIKEVEPDFRSYHVTLPRGEPSLKTAISQLVETEEYLQQHQPAVITVTGTEQLFFLKFNEEQSEQDKFFGYLQWTREGMREYPFAIVIWVTNNLLQNLQKKAPDFWSWRTGVFRFHCMTKNTVSPRDLEPFRNFINDSRLETADNDNEYFLPLEDLQRLIREIESQSGTNEATLASLYTQLGQIYRRRLRKGESQNYQNELDLAIGYFQKAVELQEKLGLELELATSLINLGYLYDSQGKYEAAEPLYLQALEICDRALGSNHPRTQLVRDNLARLRDLIDGSFELICEIYR